MGFPLVLEGIGCVLGRVLHELLGSLGFGKDIGCVLGRILDALLGSHVVSGSRMR